MHFMAPEELGGLDVTDRYDVTLGVVEGVYADIRSGQPQWAAIRSGLFGADVSLIPLTRAEHDDSSLHIPYSVQEIRNAPHRASSTVMSHKEEANLFRYYGVSYGSAASPAGKSREARRTMLHKHATS
jgi:hypothetical protein